MARLLLTSILLAVFLLSPRLSVGASSFAIQTHPNGGYILEGESLPVTVTVPKKDYRQIVQVALDCALYYSDTVLYVAANDKTTFRIEAFRRLPPGMCQAVAQLIWIDRDGKEQTKLARSLVVFVQSVGEP